MNLKQFKQQLQQLEDKLLTEHNLTDEKIEVKLVDDNGRFNNIYCLDHYEHMILIDT